MSVVTISRRGRLAALGLALAAGPALAEDATLLSHGEQLYAANCAACHQVTGAGAEPAFPALAGNGNLADLELIVGNVHLGRGAMRAFPDFDDNDLAAVASYIRTSWGNDFGSVTPDEVTPVLAALAETPAGETRSILDGVYTEAQAERGDPVLMGACAKCHGTRLNGSGDPDQPPSPPIARASFLASWSGDSLESLYTYILTQMPLDNPGQLDEQQTADVVARMLQVSGAPAGDEELPGDAAALGAIVIESMPE